MSKNFEVLISEEAKEFIMSLDIKLQKKIAYNIQKSREVNDTKLLKKLTEEIWEFRTRYDKQQIRLLAFWDPNLKSLIVCTHGFIKKTQKTPKSELKKALEFRKKYLNQ
ncbi:MAG: type II toxin-antitoxin system RelE/ParE family toxin [Lewinellaceae bacterium]|nr:type II toxin-antitoxin system RelE/ParE family toxin [Lewinellaceae bacterium]